VNWYALIVGTAVAETVLSVLFGAGRKHLARIGTNFGLGVALKPIMQALLLAPILVWSTAHPIWARPAWLDHPAMFVVDLLILDAGFWLKHYLQHNVSFLWRFHAIHHSDEHPDLSTGLRNHPFDRVYNTLFRAVFVMLFAIPAKHMAILDTFGFAWGLFMHVESMRLPAWFSRSVGFIVALPRFHIVHHLANLPYTNTNYGNIFSFWDRIAKTTLLDEAPATAPRGVDNLRERGFVHALLQPFVPSLFEERQGERPSAPSPAPLAETQTSP
jgi:sterol desaturase/sphingolipid hydroxylase (fatty acid hydroxylase superfamily)